MRKKIALTLVIGVACFAFIAVAFATGPAMITITPKNKPAFQFPHAKHQAANKCTACHADDKGGKVDHAGMVKGHAACHKCHKAVGKGPTDCKGCHT